MVSRILILSDGRFGHLNQSIAFAKYCNLPYEIAEVRPRYFWSKAISYLLDRFAIRTTKLFENISLGSDEYSMVVGTGSATYYLVKTLAYRLSAKSIVMMLPRGYLYDFDIMFAQTHDNPPKKDNIIRVDINCSMVEPKGFFKKEKKAVGIIIGGSSRLLDISAEGLKRQLDFVKANYDDYEIAVATSPRTPIEIENLIESYGFDYEVIFSKNSVNPIPDFLDECETVFVTGDSTSMISECVSFGDSNVVVLPVHSKGSNKFDQFVKNLESKGYLHIFDGTIKNRNKKIDFREHIKGVGL